MTESLKRRVLSVYLGNDLRQKLSLLAGLTGVSKAKIIRLALVEYIDRTLDELLREQTERPAPSEGVDD